MSETSSHETALKTRFAGLKPWQALTVLAVTGLAVAGCLVVTFAWPDKIDPTKTNAATATAGQATPEGNDPSAEGKDLILYTRIVERVHAGENYYAVAASELPAGGYPTGSMFNWRLPTYAYVLGLLPNHTWGMAILIGLVIVVTLMFYGVLARAGGVWMGALAVLLLAGAYALLREEKIFFIHEFWAGALIALSVAAYAQKRWPLGLAAGLAALFYRELTLLYCVIAAVLAWRERRRLELALWLVGFALFAGFLVFHATQVSRHAAGAPRGQALDWMEFGGLPFVMKTCRINYILFCLPGWMTALYLPLALLGLLGWRGSTGLRAAATALAYLAAFAVVGRPFNYYWGAMIVPLLCLGFVWSPVALYDLLKAVRRPVAEPVTGATTVGTSPAAPTPTAQVL